ncbi:hypothetical protein TEA_008980 [Camellia sinensis var. sinensis]|uniref:Uncharacterized protein n=1 Tax=Camellia sinensis var. sinensis TaxID=542762 RepID=A0A4S4EIZ9_CAMSN|nr:hypothetical protein TEA_008980 [Camellia sinensis var. sinensis]
MQRGTEVSVGTKMEELRLVCDREITIQQHRIDAAISFFRKSLQSTKAKAQETIQIQDSKEMEEEKGRAKPGHCWLRSSITIRALTIDHDPKLGKLKGELREAEDHLVKALAAKTRKEAKQMAMTESISATRARIEELKRIVEDQNTRKDEYTKIISQQFEGSFPQVTSCDQEYSTISVSAPVSSVSTDSRSESLSKQKELQAEETNRQYKKVNRGRGVKPAILSLGSASSLCRSPRFKVSLVTVPIKTTIANLSVISIQMQTDSLVYSISMDCYGTLKKIGFFYVYDCRRWSL